MKQNSRILGAAKEVRLMHAVRPGKTLRSVVSSAAAVATVEQSRRPASWSLSSGAKSRLAAYWSLISQTQAAPTGSSGCPCRGYRGNSPVPRLPAGLTATLSRVMAAGFIWFSQLCGNSTGEKRGAGVFTSKPNEETRGQ